MPRFFCDYCDAYLTHDSAPGRQQHIRGWKHRENFKAYYQNFFQQWAIEQQMKQAQQMQEFHLQMMTTGMPHPGMLPGPPMMMPPMPGTCLPVGMPGAPPAFRPPPTVAPPSFMQPPQPPVP